MPYREIADDGGVWIVFSTQPRSGANVRPRYACGWLSFHRGPERRRLSPIPSGWDSAGDDQLRLWLRSSEVVTKRTEDDEALTSSAAAVSEGLANAREDSAKAEKEPEEIPHTAWSGPGGAGAGASDQDLRSSLERIRGILGTIRGDIV